jgi:POT family proton-dependent oligopeptide transporter
MNQIQNEKTIFGHPIGLYYLFFAELWERFSFYGMRALLVLYLGTEIYQDLLNGKEIAYEIYAAYGALVYFTPAIGGLLADRYLGMRYSIVLGGIFMCLGHFAMALPGETIFFYALGLLIVGNGFFKPNISTMVGGLYEQGDTRRDNAFTIFYMGINIGGFLAPLLCGWLATAYGWHYGFGLAGIGMLAGLLVFLNGISKGYYHEVGHTPEALSQKSAKAYKAFITLLSIGSVAFFAYLVKNNNLKIFMDQGLLSVLLIALLVIVLLYIAFECITNDKVTRGRLIVILFMCFFITVFWAFFEQAGSSLTYFAQESVNLKYLNAAQTNSINSFYIILLAIPFSMLWTLLSKMKLNPNTPIKFALAILQLGLGFLIFSLSARYMDGSARVPMFFLMIGWLVITTGELFISPIGLSKITELAPARLASFLMGVWFLSSAFAHYIAGGIAKLTVPEKSETAYVESNDMITRFANWSSGMDHNKVGSFMFEYDMAFDKLLDTSVAEYPTTENFEKYKSVLNQMSAVSDKWTRNQAAIDSNLNDLEAKMLVLQAIENPSLKQEYQSYIKQFIQKSNTESFKKAYDLKLRQTELLENNDVKETKLVEKEMGKISQKWIVAAEALIQHENNLSTLHPEWSESVYQFTDAVSHSKSLIKPYPALATYSKVFAQIAFISFAIALLAFLLAPFLKKLMYGLE